MIDPPIIPPGCRFGYAVVAGSKIYDYETIYGARLVEVKRSVKRDPEIDKNRQKLKEHIAILAYVCKSRGIADALIMRGLDFGFSRGAILGMSDRIIAALDIKPESVSNQIKKLIDKGLAVKEIADRLKIDRSYVYLILKRRQKKC